MKQFMLDVAYAEIIEPTTWSPYVNNRDRILTYFAKTNIPLTFDDVMNVDVLRHGRKKEPLLRDILRRMVQDGLLDRSHASPGKRSTYTMTPKGVSASRLARAFEKPSVKSSSSPEDLYFVTDEQKPNNSFVAHQQMTLEDALADWTARKATGGKPRLFRVVELHPTLTAKL